MRITPPTLLLLLVFGCKPKTDKIKITGYIKNIPASQVYLTDAYHWEHILDSAEYKNGEFHFELDDTKYKEPFTASIYIPDTNLKKNNGIFFINPITSTTKDTFSNNGIFLVHGNNIIKGDYSSKLKRVSLTPTSESVLYFDPVISRLGLGYYKERGSWYEYMEDLIARHSGSYFLVHKMYEYRDSFTPAEINVLLSLFNEDVWKSPTASKLKSYANNVVPPGYAYPDMELVKPDNTVGKLFERKGKLTMLVFWASWCGPCRQEIPLIKQIHDRYSSAGLVIKSISLDENKEHWIEALTEETMRWEQFALPYHTAATIKAQYRISAVPLVVFLDENNRALKSFTGYRDTNTKDYEELINQYMPTKD
ncbi:thiol-disulfide isomerase/thioredoxin [Filimonas zeae]|uniref:TlpA disulfide reductase family protein n=1 Tax=Filimonas zeae TaxID=1737353 RepID=UPI0016699DFD|nr:TlpA disulfide reductase family protein [Filimonas zeae]MDR6340321.1 thiol-disulfide isomerase/thioredoxin [Filimonas zeae]